MPNPPTMLVESKRLDTVSGLHRVFDAGRTSTQVSDSVQKTSSPRKANLEDGPPPTSLRNSTGQWREWHCRVATPSHCDRRWDCTSAHSNLPSVHPIPKMSRLPSMLLRLAPHDLGPQSSCTDNARHLMRARSRVFSGHRVRAHMWKYRHTRMSLRTSVEADRPVL